MSGEELRAAAQELVDDIDAGRMFMNKVLRVRAALAVPSTPEPSGTLTQCPIEGVHPHPFRGPHVFREWDPATYPSPSEPNGRTETLRADDAGYVDLPDGTVFPTGRGHAVTISRQAAHGETWRCPSCHDTTAPEGMCQKCGIFGVRAAPSTEPALDPDTLVVAMLEAVKGVALRHGINPTEFLDAANAAANAVRRLADSQPSEETR